MLNDSTARGRDAAIRFFKLANDPAFMSTPAAPPAPAGPGLMDRAKAFGQGQMGAAKDLYGNLRQGLGGAATPALGMEARQNALGNMRTLAPSLLAGGALYMLHRHNQAKREQQARQQQMMMGGGSGYPGM
jgi:hypothetical protein